jgi:hypothetical protein
MPPSRFFVVAALVLPLAAAATATAATAAAAAAAAAPAIALFVSTAGSDADGDGSRAAPFASIARAQAAVRAATANASLPLAQDAVVTVEAGVYVSPAALRFGAADSGSGGFAVRYEGAGAGAPAPTVLYVGVQVTGWTRSAPGSPVWVANVTAQAPPAPPAPPAPKGCGLVEPGYSYDGNDITQVLVPTDDVGACCAACANTTGCAAWSLCVDIVCGTPEKPINCYLKTSAAGRRYFGPQRTSGLLPGRVAAATPWKFFTLTEGDRAATIARLPNRGSGYLTSLGISNSDNSISWPAGSSYVPANFSVENAHVFCNLGADWFTETRKVTAVDFSERTLSFAGRQNGVASCKDKAYLQGPKEFIDEPGEWALEPAAGLLYYWPYDESSLLPGSATPVVAASSPEAVDFRGDSREAPVHDVVLSGLELRGSDFTPDGQYLVFPPGRPNDTPAPTNTGMVRLENAVNIALVGLKLLHAGLSAVFVNGAASNVTVSGCWIEGAGFCGVATNGPYPGDGPYTSAEDAYANFGHEISDSLIYDVGKRVGHAAGVWLFQSGDVLVRNNRIKEVPRNGVGLYGIRFGAGAGLGGGVLPGEAFGKQLDFFSSLDLLTTRRNTIAYNLVENAVRDTCDSGAFETWGVGVNNTFHTNALSDMDSGGVDGSWMNFMFSDDASHWENFSSNILYNVRGKGSEESTMQKSIYDVFENNVIAFSVLGHAANLQPYIEPAGMMTIRRNVFAFLSPADGDGASLTIDVNGYTAADVLHSCSLLPGSNGAYGFTNETVPRGSDPVILELDYNLYHNASHNASDLAPSNPDWDAHSVSADPQFVGQATPAWLRTHLDLALEPSSPAFALPGFKRIETERIGLGAAFAFDLSTWARRGARGAKIQAETYDRQVGLWREGSYAISPGASSWPFDAGAWASYLRAEAASGATVFQLRIDPRDAARTVALAVGSPSAVVATFTAAAAGAPAGVVGTYNTSLPAPLVVPAGAALFLLPDGECVIDWFALL